MYSSKKQKTFRLTSVTENLLKGSYGVDATAVENSRSNSPWLTMGCGKKVALLKFFAVFSANV